MPNNDLALAELQSQIWEMEPRRLAAFLSGIANGTYIAQIPDNAAVPPEDVENAEQKMAPPAPVVRRGVAIIPINGILMNRIPRWLSWFGIEATAYPDVAAQVKSAMVSDEVDRIHLEINSPGGTVAGVHETAEVIFAARKTKTVSAHINDLGASGAYHLAAQAQSISVGPNAMVGSIGVFSVFVDSSKAAEEEGIKVHIVRSGDFKGMGIPGVKISPEQIASYKNVIDGMADNFVKAVARGRGIKVATVRALATGEIWIAATAIKNGLADNVIGGTKSNSTSKPKGSTMDTADEKPVEPKVDIEKIKTEAGTEAVAKDRNRLAEMMTEFVDDLEFATEQHASGATLIEAKAAYADVLKDRLATMEKNQANSSPTKPAVGAKPVVHSEGGEINASGFLEQARAMAKEEGIKTSEAIKKLKRQDPELFARTQNPDR